MKPVDVRPEIAAALVWDVPALRQSDAPGAKDFFAAMSGHPRALEIASADSQKGPLALAAQAVAKRLMGDSEAADAVALRVAGCTEVDGELLGIALHLWFSDDPGEAVWDRAEDLTLALTDPRLRSHMLTKLTSYSIDGGNRERAVRLLDQAIGCASEHLRSQLQSVAAKYFGLDHGLRFRVLDQRDEWIDLPWVVATAEYALQQAVADYAHTRLSGSPIQRFGQGPISQLALAESQASWAGALWIRDPLRTQLGYLLVLDDSSSEPQLLDATALLVQTGAKDVGLAIDSAEPRFQRATVDTLFTDRIRFATLSPEGRSAYLRAARAAWDLMSDTTAGSVMDHSPPLPEDHPLGRDAWRVWALLSIASPAVWLPRFETLTRESQRGVLSASEPHDIELLSDGVCDAMSRALTEPLTPHLARLRIALATRIPELAATLPEILVSNNTPEVLLAAASQHPHLVEEATLRRAEADLVAAVTADLRRSELGSVSIGEIDRRELLGAISALLQAPSASAIDILVKSAMTPRVHTEIRRTALGGLWRLSSAGRLPPEVADTLRFAPTDVPDADFAFIRTTPDYVRAIVAAIRTTVGRPPAVAEMIALARSSDAETRRVVIRTVPKYFETADATTRAYLRGLVLGALYDPDSAVTALAAASLTTAGLLENEVRGAAIERLTSLYRKSNRLVRARVARTAKELRPQFLHDEDLAAIVRWASSDRSWQVRSSVQAP